MAKKIRLITWLKAALPLVSLGFWGHVVRRFYGDRCLRSAGVLSYTTLLAIVPLATVVFGLFAAFPVFEGVRSTIEEFVFTHFLPASGEVVRENLQQFTAQARQLTVPGAIMLFATSLMTLAAIDQALNRIWQSEGHRRGLTGFLIYWAILTLGPLLIAASVGLSSYLFSLPLMADAERHLGLKTNLLEIMPFVLSAVAITLLYLIVPNQRVRIRSAIIGGILGALFFEAAKRGFALYIQNFPTYQIIYGAFSAVPLFLIWIYIVWGLLLLGAEITYALDHYEEEATAIDPHQRLYLAVRVLGYLQRASLRGEDLEIGALEAAEPRFTGRDILGVLADLEQINYLARTDEESWVVKRDLHLTPVSRLFKDLTPAWPPRPPGGEAVDTLDRRLEELVEGADRGVDEAMSEPLAHLFAAESASGSEAEPQNGAAPSIAIPGGTPTRPDGPLLEIPRKGEE
jgi:membrane protein